MSKSSFYSKELSTEEIEKFSELKKRLELEEEQNKIYGLKTHDFGNGVTFIQYRDNEDFDHTIVYKKKSAIITTISSEHPLFNWSKTILPDGTKIETDPNDPNNVFIAKDMGFDITNFKTDALFSSHDKDKKEGYGVHYRINNGEIEVDSIQGDPEGKIFFKNGDRLQTINKNGELIELHGRDKLEALHPSSSVQVGGASGGRSGR